MRNNKFDIIVPVYNCASKITELLNSVLAQTYKEYTLYIVDDGSTDLSYSVCRKYAEGNQNIVIIRQNNSGPCIARRNGFKAGYSEYILFLDADDYVEADMLKKMNEIIDEKEPDIIEFGFQKIDETGKYLKTIQLFEEEIENDVIMHYLKQYNTTNYLWNKVIRRTVIREKDFTKLRYSEDALMLANVYTRCQKLIIIPDILYYYRVYDGSACSDRLNPKKFDILTADAEIFKIASRSSHEHALYAAVNSCAHTAKLYGDFVSGNLITPELESKLISTFDKNYKLIKHKRKIAYRYSSKSRIFSIEIFHCSKQLYLKLFNKIRKR